MKPLVQTLLLACFILFNSCDQDEEGSKPIADFEVIVSGEAPEAVVTLINKSTNEQACSWSYSNGFLFTLISSGTGSGCESPINLDVDKAGEFHIYLNVSKGSDTSSKCLTVNIPGSSPVETYQNIEFGLPGGEHGVGRFFSFNMDQMFKDGDIALDTIGSSIDLAFTSHEDNKYYFLSPDAEEFDIAGATMTKIDNTASIDQMTVAEFDAMNDDKKLSLLDIENTNEYFEIGSIPGIVLFELSSGRRGVIKTKEINDDRLLVDIKIQKYAGEPLLQGCFAESD
ncbi:MAG TPA: hypothetical protein VD927_07950 [Chryseosolibacter sp.]|nr:hypothetical protein [Chryseosolibacter sp.]